MARHFSVFLLVLLAATFGGAASAQALPVDDSGSQVLGSTLKLRWDEVAPRPGASATLSGTITVYVRLDVSPWRGRKARIYHVLPSQAGTSIVASWTTRGVLLPGKMRDGERVLVYAGPIDADRIEDTFRLEIQADGNRLSRQEQLDFSFEIELDTP